MIFDILNAKSIKRLLLNEFYGSKSRFAIEKFIALFNSDAQQFPYFQLATA